jgi:muramoyltetrapeptide carboxypeptidase
MINDQEIKAILFGRGGYGLVRIIDHIDFRALQDQPKWMVGYSDISILHMHAHRNLGIATLHAHMSGGYQADQFDNDSIMSIFHALTGRPTHYTIPASNQVKEYCKGELIGGNLRTICDLIGTPSDVNYEGKILVLEDINEYKHSIDRMMYQLYRTGKLDKLAGLIVGGFTDTKEQTTAFGQSEYELIWEKVGNFNYPVCFGFPVGHQARNRALKMGVMHELIINENQVELKEITLPSA